MILTIYLPHTILPIGIQRDLDLIIRFCQKLTFVIEDEDLIIFNIPILIKPILTNYYFIQINKEWMEIPLSLKKIVFNYYQVIPYYIDKRLVTIQKNNIFKCIRKTSLNVMRHPPILLKLEITKLVLSI